MSLTTRILTADELFHLPNDGLRHELRQGELKTMTPAGSEHGAIVMRLSWRLGRHVEEHQLGIVFGAETGFVLARDPDTVLAPDIAFVAQERASTSGIPKAFFPGPPDLAVEVVSPGDTANEVAAKVQDWLTFGSKMIWVVDPKSRTATIHRAVTDTRVLSADDLLEAAELLPGFRCRVGDIFVQ